MNQAQDPDKNPPADEPLDIVLAEYLAAADSGNPPDRRTWMDRYPELAGDLTEFFAAHDEMHRVAAPLREALSPTLLAADGSASTLGLSPGPGQQPLSPKSF